MNINNNKPHLWKQDIADSVDMYNDWFMKFAPKAFRETRINTTKDVEDALASTNNLRNLDYLTISKYPQILPTLRMSTCPPIAIDRLIGLSGVPASLVKRIEKSKKLPSKLQGQNLNDALTKICSIIMKMADPDIFVWLAKNVNPTNEEVHRAATIIADRLCGSVANPIIRNAQEKRQLELLKTWLENRGYQMVKQGSGMKYDQMTPGSFSFRMNVPVKLSDLIQIQIPIDAIIMPLNSSKGDLPIFFEAKSAGDFANVNKRRKEEAVKMGQLKKTYGERVNFNLLLCGYFDSGYLGYEASEGIDWVWEHRINDLIEFGI